MLKVKKTYTSCEMAWSAIHHSGDTDLPLVDREGATEKPLVLGSVDSSGAWDDNWGLAIPNPHQKHTSVSCFEHWNCSLDVAVVVSVNREPNTALRCMLPKHDFVEEDNVPPKVF